jgi:hypothetical protein
MEMVNQGKVGVYRPSDPSTLGCNRPGPSKAEAYSLFSFSSGSFRVFPQPTHSGLSQKRYSHGTTRNHTENGKKVGQMAPEEFDVRWPSDPSTHNRCQHGLLNVEHHSLSGFPSVCFRVFPWLNRLSASDLRSV